MHGHMKVKLVTMHLKKQVKTEHGHFRQCKWYVPPEYKLEVIQVKTTVGDKHSLNDWFCGHLRTLLFDCVHKYKNLRKGETLVTTNCEILIKFKTHFTGNMLAQEWTVCINKLNHSLFQH
jgi:hypothetical protein